MQQSFTVSGMHCQGCAAKIEQALATYGETVSVDFASGSLHVANQTATLEEMNQKVSTLGPYKLSMPLESVPRTIGVEDDTPAKGIAAYYPLILIVFYLAIASFAHAGDATDWMLNFMAGFFLVFSFFKLLNLRAFADSYAMYDLVAGRWKPYALIYPFLELVLGLAYLFSWHLRLVLWLTLVLMLVSGAGVIRSMRRKQAIRCACLGAVLNVPVSTVTLIEDFAMAAMAAFTLCV